MQLQLQNLACGGYFPSFSAVAYLQQPLSCSSCPLLCTLGSQLGGGVSLQFRQETAARETISAAAPSGFLWGCQVATLTGRVVLAVGSRRTEGLGEVLEEDRAIMTALAFCGKAGPQSAQEMREASKSSQILRKGDEGSQSFSL